MVAEGMISWPQAKHKVVVTLVVTEKACVTATTSSVTVAGVGVGMDSNAYFIVPSDI